MTLRQASPSTSQDQPIVLYAHLLALFNLAIAQPLFDVLHRSPEFFIAHRADAWAIAALIVAASFLGATAIALIELLSGLISNTLRGVLHLLSCGLLVALGLLPALKGFELGDAVLLVLAGGIGGLFALAFGFSATLRSIVGVASLAALVVPALFFLQLRALDIPSSTPSILASPAGAEASSTPVVLIVFDQLPTAALLAADRSIDALRHPNFAELAERSIWFRNGSAVAQDTVRAVPAILTGRYPDNKRSPVLSQYPQNIFTLLMHTHWLNPSELMTRLAPEDYAGEESARPPTRRAMLRDVAIIYLHILLPPGLREDVPTIEDQVSHFGVESLQLEAPRSAHRSSERIGQVSEFLKVVEASARPEEGRRGSFHFLHIAIPHTPYMYDPNGILYTRRWRLPGMTSGWSNWGEDPEPPLLARQRFLLQVILTDRLLGRIIDKLEAAGLYDDSLIVVTSDHGASFTAGRHTRAMTRETYRDVLYVPILVKLPGQQTGRVDDRNAQVIDIVPTIAAVVESELPWRVDGRSLLGPPEEAPDSKRAVSTFSGAPALDDFPAAGGGEFSDLRDFMRDLRFEREAGWVALRSEWDSLLGSPIALLDSALGLDATLYGSAESEQFELERISGWIQGEVRAPEELHSQQWGIAVAIDGRIAGFARSFPDGDTPHAFSLMLPRDGVPHDPSRIEARVIGGGTAPARASIPPQ